MTRKKIAVLTASIDREYQQDFAHALAEAGRAKHMDVCFFNSQGHMNFDVFTSYDEESVIYELPELGSFDGVVSMTATMGCGEVVARLHEILEALRGKPHVSIDVPMDGAVSILFDDALSVEKLTDHLIEKHGARRFAFISGPLGSEVALPRMEACRRSLARHGLTLDEDLVFCGEWTRVGGREAILRLLELGQPLPDAIVCANDDMAISAIEALAENGVRVPEDVMVTGFDALREAVALGVTTVARPIARAAKEAVNILADWIAGKEPAEKRHVLPTVLIRGGSCGCGLDPGVQNEKLRALNARRWEIESILTRASLSFSALTCVGNESEIRCALGAFAANWGVRELYLCVDPAVCRGNETDRHFSPDSFEIGRSYPEDMLLLYGLCDGQERELEHFMSKELVPGLWSGRKRPVRLVFSPLYYRGRDFGYVAMELGEGTGPALYSILMLLSGALMSLYLQANIRKNAIMEEMTIHDVLTGMLNRRGFLEQAPAVFDRARREGKNFAVISADMDHLKEINDVYGHANGDEAIRRMGKCLMYLEEKRLIPVHISGDEFIAFGIVKSRREGERILRGIREVIDEFNREDPWISPVDASFGIYTAVPREGEEIDDFLVKADRAMYRAKNRKHSREEKRPATA